MDFAAEREGVDDVEFMPVGDDAGAVDEVEIGVRAMQALNRRVKHQRGAELVLELLDGLPPEDDRFSRVKDAAVGAVAETDRIYALKDRFLDALVAAGRASVGRFTVSRPMYDFESGFQENEYLDETFRNRVLKVGTETQTWYLVTAGDYSFHVPGESAGPATRAAAVEIPPHDPYQEAREVPETGLTLEEELAAVERAIEDLRAGEASP